MALTGTADLHIHTTYSDGTAIVPAVLAHVAASNLDVIAITDHNTIAGALEARRLARDFGVDVVVGEEVSTAEGHLLALFIEDLLPPGRPAAETIAAIHAQGGLCIAPHPYDWAVTSLGRWGFEQHYATDWPVDAIEVFNASLTWARTFCNDRAQRVAATLRVPAVGGSDAHSLATIGTGYTRFAGTTANDLYRSIASGQVSWGGQRWSVAQYLEIGWLSIRQRTPWEVIRLIGSDLPFLRHPQVAVQHPAATTTQPHALWLPTKH